MGIETTLFSIFGGNKAAGEIKEQQRKTLKDINTQQQRQEGVNSPYLARGTDAFNALADFAMSAPGTLDPVSQAIEDDVAQGITGRFSAMGLTDSGAHTNALARALLPLRLNLRNNRMGELAGVAGFGERGANRFTNIGQFATANRAGARNALGEAGTFPWLNATNALYRWENQALDAAGKAAGGGFS